jgi:dTDP-4-dehydrorhamnose reductase
VLGLAADPEKTLRFVTDQRGSPTMAADLAATLVLLVGEGATGLFHVTNDRPVTWYEFVQEILVAGGHSADRVLPITTDEMVPPRAAPRPRNSAMEAKALRLCGYPALRDHGEALEDLVRDLSRPPG